VAEQLGVCRETVYRLIASGEVSAVRVGSALRVLASDLAAYLARCRT
jgi:excisionase family DNA binding protein